MKRQPLIMTLSLLLVVLAFQSYAVPPVIPPKGISTFTSYLKQFNQFELELMNPGNSKATDLFEQRLSPMFELRQANGQVVSREDTMKALLAGSNSKSTIQGLLVYEVGPEAVANFTLKAPGKPNQFVVDVWMQVDNAWQLRVRFISEVH